MIFLIPLLLACADTPYPEYWEGEQGPDIRSVSPASVTALGGGETLRIEGSALATARTVVVGTRNATILEATDAYVDVTLPAGAPGGGVVDVAVVTEAGMSYAEAAFTYAIRGQDYWTDESASATLYKIDCPVEVWSQASPQAEWEYAYWCGTELGYAAAYAFDGTGPQPGFSGDQADMVELSTLPPVGELRVWDPGERRPPTVPYLYGVHAEDEAIGITTPRDFGRDLDIIAERDQLLKDYYYWYQEFPESVSFEGPVAMTYGPDGCYEQELTVLDGYGQTLEVDGAPGQASGVILGSWVHEDYGGGHIFDSVGIMGSATVQTSGDDLVGDPTGAELLYDGYSGWYFHDGVAGTLGPTDLPSGATWDIDLTRLGEFYDLGRVEALQDLTNVRLRAASGGVGSAADLLAGDVMITRGEDLIIAWDPGIAPEQGLDFLMIEIRVYDADLDDPVWLTELSRLVAQADDTAGSFTIPSGDLQALPVAVNSFTPAGDLKGTWAELSVARHQLRKVSLAEPGLDDGDLLVDFIHIVNSPVMLRNQ